MRWAAAQTRSAERRAQYLRHALDEARHARVFQRRARELASPVVEEPDADAEDLFALLGERRFIAFVTMSEGRARREFEGYARAFLAKGDLRTAAVFRGIIAEEVHHERYSRAILDAMYPSAARAKLAIAWVSGWELWRSARRAARLGARGLYFALMSVLFFAVVPPFSWLVRRARPTKTGWISGP